MSQTLQIQIHQNQPLAIVILKGVLARLDVYKLKKEIEDSIANHNRFLIVDLREVTFIDSAGIGVLCQIRPELMRQGGRIVLIRPTHADVIYSLESASIDKVFEIFDEHEEAFDSLNHKFNLGLRSLQEFFGQLDNDNKLDSGVVDQLNGRLDNLEKRFDALEELLRKSLRLQD